MGKFLKSFYTGLNLKHECSIVYNVLIEDLKDVDKELLTYSNSDRLDKISSLLDRLSEVIDKSKQK